MTPPYIQHGSLTADQVRLLLRDLPVDLSFADEDDVLVYWSGETYDSCDPKWIGRDVRDCHPANSLDGLEEILRAFRAGERDVAEGWGQDGERFKHTRYFAVRDDAGAYKGILEVNQDVTAIRALSGSQSLPGWGE